MMSTMILPPSDEDVLVFELSDEALEAAARTIPGTAVSLPGAPTINVLVSCCGNDIEGTGTD